MKKQIKIVKVDACLWCEYNRTVDSKEYKAICEIEDKEIQESEMEMPDGTFRGAFPDWCPLENYDA